MYLTIMTKLQLKFSCALLSHIMSMYLIVKNYQYINQLLSVTLNNTLLCSYVYEYNHGVIWNVYIQYKHHNDDESRAGAVSTWVDV